MTTRKQDRAFEAETKKILLLYHHGKISKREFERRMAEHMGETQPYFEERED